MPPKVSVSMETIAKDLSVSKVTVSKALNDKEGVSEELRKIIKDKAAELGYHVNVYARCLKTRKTYNIGIIIPERFLQDSDTYYFEVYAKLVRTLASYGYTGILEVLEKEKEEKLELPRIYLEKKIDALIVIGECYEYVELFSDFDIPVLFFDFHRKNIKVDSILVDNFNSGEQITNLLINKGHRKIGFIGNIYSTSSIKDRFLGYYRALLDANIFLNPKYIISDRDENGKLIEIEFKEDMPTAFVCNNDQVAYNVVVKLKENNYRVPEDISVVAFDNTIYSKICPVKLTTVDTNVDQMVEVAAKAINKKLTKPGKVYDSIFVKGSIIERDSVKDLIKEE